MFVDYGCVHCHHPLRALERHRGASLSCPNCSAAVVLPLHPEAKAETSVNPRLIHATKSPSQKPLSPCTQGERGRGEGGRSFRGFSPLTPCSSPPSTGERGACETDGEGVPIGAPSFRFLLPWLLLTPAALALVLWKWTGHGVLWAGMGVALGGAFLLLSQRGRWPMPLRIGVSLSLALVGHGLTLASPSTVDSGRSARQTVVANERPLLAIPDPRFPMQTETLANISVEGEVENLLLSHLRRETKNSPPSVDLKVTGQIGDLLAATSVSDDSIVTATREGAIKEFSISDFQLRRVHRLDGVAYRLAFDRRRRLLWAAVCTKGDLRANRHCDRPIGRADLHVYPLPRSAADPLQPMHVVPVDGDVLELLPAPDDSALFYLAKTGDGVHLGRLDAQRKSLDCRIDLPDGTQAMCLTPDGRTLYAAGSGRVHVVDPATLQTRRVVDVKIDAVSVAADNEERVYISERGLWTNLIRLDLRGEQPAIQQWSARLQGCVYLKLSPDQYRLYAGTSSVISDGLNSFLVRGHPWDSPLLTAVVLSSPSAPVQGEFFLTAEGRFLINRWGCVYTLAQGEAKVQFVNGAGTVRNR